MNFWQLRCAARSLRGGGLIAYPTESVFGLGCDPFDSEAVARLLAVKQRPAGQGLIMIASSTAQLAPFLGALEHRDVERLAAAWPGPVTWIIPAGEDTPPWLVADDGTVALRVTAHRLAAELCRQFGGPIISTSANLRGRPPARTVLEVRMRLSTAALRYILPGVTGGRRRPSEIRDLRTNTVMRA